MPRIQPLLPLLRPLSAPRSIAGRQLFRFSTAVRLRAEEPSKPALDTSTAPAITAKPTKSSKASPPPSSPADAARAADLAAAEARTDADSAQAPEPKPELPSKRPNPEKTKKPKAAKTTTASSNPSNTPTTPGGAITTPNEAGNLHEQAKRERKRDRKAKIAKKDERPTLSLPPAKYHVAKTSSKNYPIYTDYKRGGNLHITTVRKITGDLSALRDELKVFLNKSSEEVRINPLTQHVHVKGHHRPQIEEFLKARGM